MAKKRRKKMRVRSYEEALPRIARFFKRWMIKHWHRGNRRAYQKSVKALYKKMERILGPAR